MSEREHCDRHERPSLFEDKPRDHTQPSRRAETTYSFLDRSSLPEFQRVRRMLERWVERLPKKHRRRTVANMRHRAPGSRTDEIQFYGAFFELFLHEFLLGTGGQVEVEPTIDGLTPDVRVTEELPNGSQLTYVVEATDVDLERGTKLERDWNEQSVIDWLDEIPSPDYYLHIRMAGRLESLPRKKHLVRQFEKLLEEAEYKESLLISQKQDLDLEDLPKTSFDHGSWTVIGHLMPVSPEHRGKTGAFVAIGPAKGGHIDDIGKTKDRLYQKAKRYKNLDNVIIALRCDQSNDRLREVLFGSQRFTFYVRNDLADTTPLPHPHYSQRRNGFWFNSKGPQNVNIVGVVAFYGVYPGTPDRTRAIFYSNPYIDNPMPSWTKSITRAEYSEGEVRFVEGMPPYAFLGDYEIIGNPFG